MPIIYPTQRDRNRNVPALYERSHSRDKPIPTKKIIGKTVSN